MLKYVLLASTVAFATPAFAQDMQQSTAPTTQSGTPVTTQGAPSTTPDSTTETMPHTAPTEAQDDSTTTGAAAAEPAAPAPAQPAPAQPAPTAKPAAPAETMAPVEPMTPAEPAAPAEATPPAAAAAAPAPAEPKTAQQPASTPDQVSQAVGREFANYDKDANGALDQTEFKSWMGTLRKASEPSFNTESAEATTWYGQAFTQADADKGGTVNQAELVTFLTPKPA